MGRPRKNQARRTTTGSKDSASDKTTCPIISASTGAAAILPQMRPLTNQQKTFIAERHCFLLKNIEKVFYICFLQLLHAECFFFCANMISQYSGFIESLQNYPNFLV